jgi:hypothetical protein
MTSFHVNSSMPRSGSELLQALLSQHPDVYASATSPLLEYWYGAYSNINLPEVRSQDAALMKKAFTGFCRQGASGYYGGVTDRPVVVDKSRGWLQYAELLWEVFPDCKIVCTTRKIDDIVASLERIYRKHPGHPETRGLPRTPQARAQHWTSPGNFPLGLMLERINDRRARGPDDRILYVDYDNLVRYTKEVMRGVFKHLEIAIMDVDTQNVRKMAVEDDSYFGIFGDHSVRPVVSLRT